jgi:hypothetical protein
MNRNEFKQFVVECVNEIRAGLSEGSIDVKIKANRVMEVIKKSVRELYDIKMMGGGKLVKKDEFKQTLNILNEKIENKLKSEGIDVGCPIYFVSDANRGADGWYDPVTKSVYIDGDEYFVDGSYKSYSTIKFNDMHRTLEHELVHREQDVRSGGKLFKTGQFLKNGKLKFITAKDYEEISKKFNFDKMDNKEKAEFIKWLMYYNDLSELDTFANNAADRYVEYMVGQFSLTIKNYIKRTGEGSKREYSSDDVRKYVLAPIYGAKEGNNREYFNLKFLKNKLISYHRGYKFLSKENKKKWWKYVIMALLNHKFNPMTFNK